MVQQAYNWAGAGPISDAAEGIVVQRAGEVMILLASSQREQFNPHPAPASGATASQRPSPALAEVAA